VIRHCILIPVKDPARAKTRLATLLTERERSRLAWAMFEDVSRVVASATLAERVAVVTSYAEAVEHARRLGWEVLEEQAQSSESASVDWASRRLAGRGFDSVLRLPADVPLIRPEDIDELLAIELPAPGALLVPSREQTGTNAIIRTPPDLFPSRFGPNSLALHKQEAARVGVRCQLHENARIALDIDEPADIRALLRYGQSGKTFDLLAEINIVDRLGDQHLQVSE
jgi:2-phospho-L-lactate/phosphoenolpyruvate guanylyltransferase